MWDMWDYAIWALRDGKTSKTCPPAITCGTPPIVIVDKDNFKIDMLSGNATGVHGRIALYVQPESHKEESNDDSVTKCRKNGI